MIKACIVIIAILAVACTTAAIPTFYAVGTFNSSSSAGAFGSKLSGPFEIAVENGEAKLFSSATTVETDLSMVVNVVDRKTNLFYQATTTLSDSKNEGPTVTCGGNNFLEIFSYIFELWLSFPPQGDAYFHGILCTAHYDPKKPADQRTTLYFRKGTDELVGMTEKTPCSSDDTLTLSSLVHFTHSQGTEYKCIDSNSESVFTRFEKSVASAPLEKPEKCAARPANPPSYTMKGVIVKQDSALDSFQDNGIIDYIYDTVGPNQFQVYDGSKNATIDVIHVDGNTLKDYRVVNGTTCTCTLSVFPNTLYLLVGGFRALNTIEVSMEVTSNDANPPYNLNGKAVNSWTTTDGSFQVVRDAATSALVAIVSRDSLATEITRIHEFSTTVDRSKLKIPAVCSGVTCIPF